MNVQVTIVSVCWCFRNGTCDILGLREEKKLMITIITGTTFSAFTEGIKLAK